MKILSIFGKQFSLLTLTTVLLSVALLATLGNWQLARLKEKQNFINKIETNIANPAIQLESLTTPELYSKITITGHFLNNSIFLYGRRSAYPEKDGYYILSPFQDDLGNIYLISRGWIPQNLKSKGVLMPYGIKETITAFIMPSEIKSLFTPNNDNKNNIWFTLDLQEAKNKFHLTNSNFYLMQIDAKSLPEGIKPLTSTYLAVIRNDHLEYAITWYCLAALLCIVTWIAKPYSIRITVSK